MSCSEKQDTIQLFLQKARDNDYYLEIASEQTKLECLEIILAQEISNRSEDDLRLLAKLTHNFKFFKEMIQSQNGEYLHKQLCKHLLLRKVSDNQVLFKQGDHGEEFFVIFSGEVKVLCREYADSNRSYSDESDDSGEGNNKNNEQKQNQQSSSQSQSSKTNKKQIQDDSVEEWQEVEKVRLKSGDCFGELALVSEGERRKATVQTTQPCVFGVLMKQDFIKLVVKENYHCLFIQNIASMAMLQHLQYSQIRALYDISEQKDYKFNNVVYAEGDTANFVYFIKSGEFQANIQKNGDFIYKQAPKASLEEPKIESIEEPEFRSRQSSIVNQIQSEKILPQQQQSKLNPMKNEEQSQLVLPNNLSSSELMIHQQRKVSRSRQGLLLKNQKRGIALKIMGKGECFGEEEVLLKKGCEFLRVHSVICVSETASVYAIPKKLLLRRLYSDSIMKKTFKSQLLAKQQQRAFHLQRLQQLAKNNIDISPSSPSFSPQPESMNDIQNLLRKNSQFIKNNTSIQVKNSGSIPESLLLISKTGGKNTNADENCDNPAVSEEPELENEAINTRSRNSTISHMTRSRNSTMNSDWQDHYQEKKRQFELLISKRQTNSSNFSQKMSLQLGSTMDSLLNNSKNNNNNNINVEEVWQDQENIIFCEKSSPFKDLSENVGSLRQIQSLQQPMKISSARSIKRISESQKQLPALKERISFFTETLPDSPLLQRTASSSQKITFLNPLQLTSMQSLVGSQLSARNIKKQNSIQTENLYFRRFLEKNDFHESEVLSSSPNISLQKIKSSRLLSQFDTSVENIKSPKQSNEIRQSFLFRMNSKRQEMKEKIADSLKKTENSIEDKHSQSIIKLSNATDEKQSKSSIILKTIGHEKEEIFDDFDSQKQINSSKSIRKIHNFQKKLHNITTATTTSLFGSESLKANNSLSETLNINLSNENIVECNSPQIKTPCDLLGFSNSITNQSEGFSQSSRQHYQQQSQNYYPRKNKQQTSLIASFTQGTTEYKSQCANPRTQKKISTWKYEQYKESPRKISNLKINETVCAGFKHKSSIKNSSQQQQQQQYSIQSTTHTASTVSANYFSKPSEMISSFINPDKSEQQSPLKTNQSNKLNNNQSTLLKQELRNLPLKYQLDLLTTQKKKIKGQGRLLSLSPNVGLIITPKKVSQKIIHGETAKTKGGQTIIMKQNQCN